MNWNNIKEYRPLLDHMILVKSDKYPKFIGLWHYKSPEELDEAFWFTTKRLVVCNSLGEQRSVHPLEISYWGDINELD